MKTNLFPAIKLTLLTIVFFVVIYGAVIWGIAYLTAPNHGRGELALKNGTVVGFSNVGQAFSHDNYFWSRPSAVNYNAAGSGGSNKGPTNEDYLQTVRSRIDTFLLHNPGIPKSQIPVELVTASGSGLDPDISPESAYVQAARIASVRKISEANIRKLISLHTQMPLFGILGPPKVNVLQLNIDLDKLEATK